MTQKQKTLRIPYFDILWVTNRAVISDGHQHFLI